MTPDDRKYQDSHEWAKLDGDDVVVGITKHAVEELTDLVYLDLPEAGADVSKGQPFGEIESVKAVSDLISPCDGKVVEVHEGLDDDLDLIADDPYGEGWMVKIKPLGADPLEGMMSAEEYEKQVADG